MALTILSYPADRSSVSSEMLFIINEATKANDPTTYPGYKYVLDLYFDGDLIARLKASPDPVNKFGVFDVAAILRYYVPAYQLDVSSNKVDYAVSDQYAVEIGEEYSDTMYTGLVIDSSRYFSRTFAARPFTSSVVLSNGIASNMPTTRTELGYPVAYSLIPHYSNVTGDVLDVSFRNAAGTVIGGISLTNDTRPINQVRQFNIDNSGNDGVAYVILSGLFDMRINYQCSKYPVYTLAWLNPYGAYESQTFGLVSKKSIELSKKSFQQLNYRVNASGEVSYQSGGVYYGGKRDYNKGVKTRLAMTSHLLSEAEYTWLADLFQSPDVYLHTSAGWMPVSIVTNNYEYRNYGNSRLTPLQFDVEFSDEFNSQYL